jgi:hypothetical protein
VIGISLVTVFLLAALVRVLGFAYFPGVWIGVVESPFMPEEGGNFWPSAWWFVAIVFFALTVVPVGVAFPRPDRAQKPAQPESAAHHRDRRRAAVRLLRARRHGTGAAGRRLTSR